jgi:hypothetical protein
MGGWYNDFKFPFRSSFKATIKSHYGTNPTMTPSCTYVKDHDCYGDDIVQYPNTPSVEACCDTCQQHAGCAAYTYHPDGLCFLKAGCIAMQPSPGNTTGLLDTWKVFQGTDYPNPNTTVSNTTTVSVQACSQQCEQDTRCKGFAYDNTTGQCVLHSDIAGGNVPSSPHMYSGCRDCQGIVGDASVFVLVRGIYDIDSLNVNVAGVDVPSTARMVTQYNHGYLQPLDYYNLAQVNGSSGLILMTTLSVLSGTANFMEGCFHFYTKGSETFPGEIMATGTEDYYNSGYYFISAYPQHLPSTGFTFDVSFNTPVGPFTTGLKWSVYRLHVADPLAFEGFGRLQWRNGDAAIPGQGKCLSPGKTGTVVGNPTASYVRSFAMAYVW